MTLGELLDLIEEIRGNERYLASLHALIATGDAQPEATYVAAAISDRLRWLNYRRERECGGILERFDVLLRAGVTATNGPAGELTPHTLIKTPERIH